LEQQDLNKRLILTLVLSFIIVMGYSYLFSPTPEQEQAQQTQQVQNATPNAPKVATNSDKTQASLAPKSTTTAQNTLLVIKSKTYKMSIDELGRISQYVLLENKYDTKEGKHLQILADDKTKPLEIRFSDTALNDEAFKTPYSYSGAKEVDITNASQTITLTQKLSSVTITKKVTINPNGSYSIDVATSTPIQYFITPGYRPMADSSRYMLVRGVLIETKDGVIKTIEDKKAKGDEVFSDAIIASAFDRYVTSVFYDFENPMNVSILKVADDNPLIFVQGKPNLHLGGYIGPKEHNILVSINPKLTDVIEFGWFSFLSKPFFHIILAIHNAIGNWGWAIIIFTLLVKLILFPLSYKGMMSMQKLKDLAPKMKDLKAKYKGDSAKMNMKMMEMYKKHNVNPMGGCLPMLLQIPVFFALYRVLLNADELQGATWIGGWINNLAVADPYYILPILMGASMWFQQRITPNNFTDPMQEKIFKWFPIAMALMFIIMPFPSGLVLYWVVNNLFTIGQQYVINKAYAKHKEAVKQHIKG